MEGSREPQAPTRHMPCVFSIIKQCCPLQQLLGSFGCQFKYAPSEDSLCMEKTRPLSQVYVPEVVFKSEPPIQMAEPTTIATARTAEFCWLE